MPARDVEDILFLDVARDVYSTVKACDQMPDCFPATLLAMAGDLRMACQQLQAAESHCQSPIEIQLLRAMFAEWYDYSNGYALTVVVGKDGKTAVYRPDAKTADNFPRLQIHVQCPVDQYTADFALCISLSGRQSQIIVVECDGHDFHAVTKEQADHDRKRDRHMTAAGIHVMRFTGSQIYQDAGKCVRELSSLVMRLERELRK